VVDLISEEEPWSCDLIAFIFTSSNGKRVCEISYAHRQITWTRETIWLKHRSEGRQDHAALQVRESKFVSCLADDNLLISCSLFQIFFWWRHLYCLPFLVKTEHIHAELQIVYLWKLGVISSSRRATLQDSDWYFNCVSTNIIKSIVFLDDPQNVLGVYSDPFICRCWLYKHGSLCIGNWSLMVGHSKSIGTVAIWQVLRDS